jgi:1-acyl-sn-glycerol-3-phosphate acyltransferase
MNLFTNFLIVLFNILITFLTTINTLIDLHTGRLSRDRIDKRFVWWSKKLLFSADIQYSVFGQNNFKIKKDKKYIIMCNHTSLYDIPLAVLSIKASIRMLVKKELMQVPVWGKAMRVSDFVSIDRKNYRNAVQDLKKAEEVLKKGIILWISPEGTRSKTGNLQPFKRGGFKLAMEMDAQIIPMGIRGCEKIMPARSLQIKRGQHVEIHFGQPIEASNYNNQTRKELITLVEKEIRQLSGQYVQHSHNVT